MARYEFDIVSRFSEEGIDPLFNKVRTRLEELSRLTYAGAPVSGQVGAAEVGAERELQRLSGAGLITPAQLADYRRQLQQIFTELPSDLVRKIGSSTRLSQQEIQRRAAGDIATDAGIILPRGPSRDAARDKSLAAARAKTEASEEEVALSGGELAQARIDEARAAHQAAALERDLAREQGDYLGAVAEARTTTNQLAAAQNEVLRADALYLESTVESATSKKSLTAAEQQALAANDLYVTAAIEGAKSKSELAATEARAAAADESVIAASAEEAAARLERAQRTKLAGFGITGADVGETEAERAAQLAALEKAQTLQRRVVVNEELLANEAGELDLMAQDRVLRSQINAELKARAAAIEAGTIEEAAPATLGQRLQYFMLGGGRGGGGGGGGGAGPGGPADLPTGGNLIGRSLLTTGRFALSGMVFYGAITSVRTLVTYSNELEKNLAAVRAQFDSMGQSTEFADFKNSLLGIARDTGVNANEVVKLGQFMKGAFNETGEAAEATRQTIKAMAVTGLNASEAINSLVAITKVWGGSIEHVSDVALGLQDRFGVASKEIIQGVGQLAPVAAEVGLTMEDTSRLIAAAAQATGRPATAVAEGFGRILPDMEKSVVEIVRLYQRIPALAPQTPLMEQLIGRGDFGQVIIQLASDWDKLSESQRQQLAIQVGNRRETQFLLALFANNGRLLKEYQNNYTDAGRTERGFAEVQKTLAQTFSRIAETARQVGDSLAEAGLNDTITDLGRDIEVLVRALGGLLRIFADLNDATDGWLGRLLVLIPMVKALQAGMTALGLATGAGAAVGGVGAAAGAAGLAGRAFPSIAGTGLLGAGAAQAAAGATAVGTLGLVAGPLVIAGATGIEYMKQRGDVRSAQQQAEERLKNWSDEDLEKLASGVYDAHQDLWSKVGSWLFKTPKFADLARGEQNRRKEVVPEVDLAKQIADSTLPDLTGPEMGQVGYMLATELGKKSAKQFIDLFAGGLDPKELTDLADRAAQGDQDALAAVKAINDAYRARPGGEAAIQGAINLELQKKTTAQKKALVESGQVLTSAEAALAAYQSGNITLGEALQVLKETSRVYEEIAEQGELTPDMQAQWAKNRKDTSKVISDALRKQVDSQNELRDDGTVTAAQATAARLSGLLKDPRFTDIDSRTQATHDLIQAEKEVHQRQIDAADKDVEEQIKLYREGIRLTDEQRAALTVENVANSPEFTGFFASLTATNQAFGQYRDQFVTNLAAAINAGKKGTEAVKAAMRAIYDALAKEYADLQKLAAEHGMSPEIAQRLESVSSAMQDLRQLGIAPNDFWDDEIKATQDSINRLEAIQNRTPEQERQLQAARGYMAELQKRKVEAQQRMDRAFEDATKDQGLDAATGAVAPPTVVGQDKAQADKLQREFDDAMSKADADLRKILAPTEQEKADIELAQAQRDLDQARQRGDKEGAIRARIAVLQAQQHQRDAALAAYRSSIDLQIAMANAAGDTAKAADLELDYANRNLQAVLANPLHGPQDLEKAQRDQINAAERSRHENLAAREADIDFQLQMGQIATAQAITMYEAILANADLIGKNEQDKRDLLLKINALKKDLQQDLTFNIPSEIKVPTLYEVRRFNENPGHYNDNRVVQVHMEINNGMDQASAQRMLSDAFGAPSRVLATSNVRRV